MRPILRATVVLAALAASAVPGAAQRSSGRMEVVGRGPVTWTRSTGLAVFRGRDGKDYAYTGTFGSCQGCARGRMYAWDVSDPARPTLTDSLVVDARVVNDVAVNAEGTLAIVTREGAESRRNGVVVLDLADPAHPKPAADYWETLTGGARAVAIEGTHAYVVDQGTSELVILDLANPADPREVGRWGVPESPERFLNDVSVKDGIAYLAYWDDGVVIVDVGNGVRGGTPEKPRMAAQFRYRVEWRGERYGNTGAVFPYAGASGRRYLFVADHLLEPGANLGRRFATGGYVHVMDVTNPEDPREVATYEVSGAGVHAVWAEADTLYAAAWTGGVRAVDISGELRGALRGREIAALETLDERTAVPGVPFAWSVVPHNGHVFATDFNSGLWIARVAPAGGSGGAAPE